MPLKPSGRFLSALLFFAITGLGFPAEIVIPPAPQDWATDAAGFLSPGALESINSRLGAYSRQNGQQILVYIGKTTAGYPIEEFAVKAFEAWKPGRQGLDDGLILFIMAEDRRIKIEVGYGLESVMTDALASRVINDLMVPGIRAGDNDGAVREAVDAILNILSGRPFDRVPESQAERSTGAESRGKSGGQTVLIIIGLIIFLILFITNPTFAFWLLLNILSGGRGGGGLGGGGGGGKFRGGGGRSGGGGASGGW